MQQRRMAHPVESRIFELYGEIDLTKRIKIQRLRWLGHIARMDTSAPVRKVFDSEPGGGSRRRGRPNLRWKDQVLSDAAAFGISNWRQKAVNREEWCSILTEAKTCNRL